MTFSVAARCPRSGAFGAALATGLPAAGAHCFYAAGAAGIVVVQGYPNPYLGIDAAGFLADGHQPASALAAAIERDPDPARRQLMVLGRGGVGVAHTGVDTFDWHGHHCAEHVTAAANMVPSRRVLDHMTARFGELIDEELWWRLAFALAAGQEADRDHLRPCRSAALRVFDGEDYPLFDLRVDVSTDPIQELIRAIPSVEATLDFVRMLPTRANRAGSFDDTRLGALGLMPEVRERAPSADDR